MELPRGEGLTGLWRLAAERHGDPFRALPEIERVLGVATDAYERAVALWIRGVVLHELDRPADAIETLRAAVEWSTQHDLADIEARARANLAISLAQTGAARASERELSAARRIVTAPARGFVTYLGALADQRRGLHTEAIEGYDRARPELERVGDHATIGVLHLNRGVSTSYLGRYDEAADDFRIAAEVAHTERLVILAAMAAHNSGFLAGRRGRLAEALGRLADAQVWYESLAGRPRQLPVLWSDRAEVLLSAGLADDARIAASTAVDQLESTDNHADLTEARLLLARASLAALDLDGARSAALRAADGFRWARRPAWVTLSCYVGRQAEYEQRRLDGGSTGRLADRLERLGDSLAAHGWPVEARDAFSLAAMGLIAHDAERAAALVSRAGRIRVSGAAPFLARWHHARALTAAGLGDHLGADRLVRSGVREVGAMVATTGSTEAALTGLRYAGELAQVGVDLALDRADAVAVAHAVERQRAVVSTLPRVGDGSGPPLATELAALRDRPSPESEHDLRQRAFLTPGRGMASTMAWRQLRADLSDRSVVFFVESRGALAAVVVDRRTTRVVALGPIDDMIRRIEFVHVALTSFAFSPPDRIDRMRERLRRDVAQLDAALVEPLRLTTGSVVVVPSPAVEAVLWPVLTSLGELDVSVAPSASAWLTARHRPAEETGPIVLVAGPGLTAADREIAILAEQYPNATTLSGPAATVARVLEHLDGAQLVHIAAHGLLRADSPMFSHLELADGPLTIYDLERLRRPPHTIVLSACEAAAVRLYPSSGALGTARGLLSIGTSRVVAALLAVEDEATCDHMVDLHRRMLAGSGPSQALRETMAAAWASGDRHRIAAGAAFVAIGSG